MGGCRTKSAEAALGVGAQRCLLEASPQEKRTPGKISFQSTKSGKESHKRNLFFADSSITARSVLMPPKLNIAKRVSTPRDIACLGFNMPSVTLAHVSV